MIIPARWQDAKVHFRRQRVFCYNNRMNILITGASSGIGAALARAYARRGERLFLSGRDTARLDEVAAQCRMAGATAVETAALDVTDEAAMREWIDRADAAAPLDLVFANAGIATGEETEANSRRTFAVNIGGVLNTVHPAVAAMRRHPVKAENCRGQIVITASIAGYGPLKACPAYSATKASVKTWGLALRGMLKSERIRVNVVAPGFVKSRITDRNTCPMPFFMAADRAAEIIRARVGRDCALIAFPWPMRLGAWLLGSMPSWVNALVNRLLPRKVI